MKKIKPSNNKEQFPRSKVGTVETRERDLVIRITDWFDDKPEDEPAFDVEVYIGGVYDYNESKTFTLRKYGSKTVAKTAAILFAQTQTAKLL